MSTFANAVMRGLHSARPSDNSAGTTGRLYYETDTTTLFRDNGSGWDSVEGTGGAGSDTTAVHTNTANEISGITEKTTLTGNDLFIIEDSAAAGVKKKVKQSNIGGGGASTADPFVVGQGTASDLSAKVQISGLTASPDINGAAGAGTSEEYDTATTGLTWAPGAPATVDSNTTILSHLYLKSTTTTEYLGTKSWSPAGAFDARAKISIGSLDTGNNITDFGLYIADSGDTHRTLCMIRKTSVFQIQAYDYAGSYVQAGSSWAAGTTMYVRISRDGSNNVSFYFSWDGLLWQLISTVSFTFTVAKIGYRFSQGVTTDMYGAVDWLRTSV